MVLEELTFCVHQHNTTPRVNSIIRLDGFMNIKSC